MVSGGRPGKKAPGLVDKEVIDAEFLEKIGGSHAGTMIIGVDNKYTTRASIEVAIGTTPH